MPHGIIVPRPTNYGIIILKLIPHQLTSGVSMGTGKWLVWPILTTLVSQHRYTLPYLTPNTLYSIMHEFMSLFVSGFSNLTYQNLIILIDIHLHYYRSVQKDFV